MERAYNLGFSDNRTFHIICTDGGLVDTPVAVNRVILAVGERVEILVDLSNDNVNSTLDLKAYNSGFALGFPGGEPNTTGQFGSLLNNTDFGVLHINVAASTSGAITSIPSVLANNTYWTAADATVNQSVTVTGGVPGTGQPFTLDNAAFNFTTINKTVTLNDIEKWTITNSNVFGHTFHIHDVEFKIVSRSPGSVGAYETGWKDVLFLPINSTAVFVARFSDYSDTIHPFMYHCHFSPHEDGGMMGQFIVKGTDTVTGITETRLGPDFTLYPNPAHDKLFVQMPAGNTGIYYLRLSDAAGRTVYMLPKPQINEGLDISSLAIGSYFVTITDLKLSSATKLFVKQ
jgi:bilirubin oxidase